MKSSDDGWCLDDEGEARLLRSVPKASPPPIPAPPAPMKAGWTIAGESAQAIDTTPIRCAIQNRLTDEELEAFSRAEFAMGTEVDFPAPDDAWFSEIRCIVPRKPAPSTDDVPTERFASIASNTLDPLELHDDIAALKKPTWWKRLLGSKS